MLAMPWSEYNTWFPLLLLLLVVVVVMEEGGRVIRSFAVLVVCALPFVLVFVFAPPLPPLRATLANPRTRLPNAVTPMRIAIVFSDVQRPQNTKREERRKYRKRV